MEEIIAEFNKDAPGHQREDPGDAVGRLLDQAADRGHRRQRSRRVLDDARLLRATTPTVARCCRWTTRSRQTGLDMSNYDPAMTEAYTFDDTVVRHAQGHQRVRPVLQQGRCSTTPAWSSRTTPGPGTTSIAAAQELTDPAKGVYGIAAPEADETTWYLTVPQTGGVRHQRGRHGVGLRHARDDRGHPVLGGPGQQTRCRPTSSS